ncbi:MAG: MmgE/PrpD family protein [Nocardiopsaceae bacterium]|nr:MmgE/PrpD family protein [Nocardiopsaceae bacterium]
MAEPTLGQRIAEFAADARSNGIPDDVAASVRQRILDVLGLCVAAHRLDTSTAAVDYLLGQGGNPQARIVGVPTPVTAAQAAFGNGVLAHSLDYDDTHLPSVLHPSASVVPTALAAAEHSGVNDAGEILSAVAVGLEVAVRLGMAGYDRELGNSVFFEHGQHATSICGAMGGAVAAAMLYGADAPGILDALGITGSMASGIIEANRTGGTVKRLHCGWAAQSAITAAQLAKGGFTGPPSVLEGRFGFFQAWLHGTFHPEEITRGLGEEWSVPGIFFKPYPANHFTHTAIDAGLALHARGVDPERIERITLAVPSAVIRTIGQPIETKRAPMTGYQAQFSGPYAVVAGLLGGGGGLGLGLDDFTDELAQDPHRRALMNKVDIVGAARCDEIYPYQFPAVVTVTTTDGEEIVEEALTNRGGPQRPLSDAELARKFDDNVRGRLPEDVAANVRERVLAPGPVLDVPSILTQMCTFR